VRTARLAARYRPTVRSCLRCGAAQSPRLMGRCMRSVIAGAQRTSFLGRAPDVVQMASKERQIRLGSRIAGSERQAGKRVKDQLARLVLPPSHANCKVSLLSRWEFPTCPFSTNQRAAGRLPKSESRHCRRRAGRLLGNGCGQECRKPFGQSAECLGNESIIPLMADIPSVALAAIRGAFLSFSAGPPRRFAYTFPSFAAIGLPHS
jgi:hypothetical protein